MPASYTTGDGENESKTTKDGTTSTTEDKKRTRLEIDKPSNVSSTFFIENILFICTYSYLLRNPKLPYTQSKITVYIQTTGSCAGASSSEFDIYRKARRRETERWESIEKQDQEEREAREYSERVQRNREEAESKTSKNAAKRQKKKEKLKLLKAQKDGSTDL